MELQLRQRKLQKIGRWNDAADITNNQKKGCDYDLMEMIGSDTCGGRVSLKEKHGMANCYTQCDCLRK